jgi:hypothetical protein
MRPRLRFDSGSKSRRNAHFESASVASVGRKSGAHSASSRIGAYSTDAGLPSQQ